MQEFYGITLEALVEAKNERLWFKTQLKLCSLWLKLREYTRGTKLLKELHRRATSSYQPSRGSLPTKMVCATLGCLPDTYKLPVELSKSCRTDSRIRSLLYLSCITNS